MIITYKSIRQPPYFRYLYTGKKETKLLSKNHKIMSENVAKTTNWVAIVTIIANAVVEILKLIFS